MIKIIPNFLDEQDRVILAKWVLDNHKKDFFVSPKMNPNLEDTRKTTRSQITDKSKIEYPKNAYDVQKKLIKYFGLYDVKYPSVFKDGIVCGVGSSGDSVYLHIDPIHYKDKYIYTMHANFIVQKPDSGGITIIDGKEYDVGQNDLLLFVPSHLKHEVNKTAGQTERILWCYGFCVDKNTINRIFNS